ncbi:MAG: aminoacyltransferase [Candidatus Azobacteroides sp.]|nr:aminoacyltransferase [Candidatus Azobacteroides sp.]
MSFTEIPLYDKGAWQKQLSGMSTYDVYHTSLYHELIPRNFGDSFLLSYSEGNYKLCFPVIIRDIAGSPFRDATSAYGYGGLLTGRVFIPGEIYSNFKDALSDYFFRKKIISAFSRLHPLIPESSVFPENMGKVEAVNTTVYLDLKLCDKQQLTRYSCSLRRQIKKIDALGLKVRIAEKKEYPAFARIYSQTMERLNAGKKYFFPDDYFEKIMNAPDFQTCLLLAEYKGEIAGGGLFTCCNEFMQYHLGAVPGKFLHLSPLKVIIDAARQFGTRSGLKYLHLGGGYGGREDGLFEFKSRFSDERSVFKVWKWIVNRPEYDALVEKRFGDQIPSTNYFPLYRYEW